MRWDYSKFDNDNETLRWTNPYFGGNQLDTTYLPPDNTFNKFTLSGNYRDLPWRSVVSARYTWSKTTSDFALGQTALNTGRVVRTDAAAREQLQRRAHQPVVRAVVDRGAGHQRRHPRVLLLDQAREQLDDRRLRQRADAAARVAASAAATSRAERLPTQIVGNCENELFNYTKNNVGFDVWWKFTRGQRLGGGWDYNNLDQTRFDYDKAHWNKFWVEYKNTMLDTVSGRLKYQYVKRDSTSNLSNAGIERRTIPNYLLRYTSAFDLQSNTTNLLKLYLDWNPLPSVGVSFEGVWARSTTTT